MKPADNIEKQIKDLRIQASVELDEKLHSKFQQVLEHKQTAPAEPQPNTWRIIMHSKITKLTAAAAIIIIVSLVTIIFVTSTPMAYALEQTIQASHSVQYLHIQSSVSPDQEPGKTWVEFDEAGQVKNVRIDLPEWAGGGDGPKLVIWKENKAQLWMKKKKSLVTIKDKTVAAQMVKMAEKLDPKLAVERLQRDEEQGKIKLEIEEPSDKAEPIVVTATSIDENDSPFQRVVLFVDQATRLVNSVELYKFKDGEYNLQLWDFGGQADQRLVHQLVVPDVILAHGCRPAI